ncbi:ATP-binding protein [Actinomadura madurae]|uniref:ATP-binding protein n=1 Tax=Actinomadura madurae TaxID=1993 RepID=UPI0020D25A0A|nr:ATP-binding protein [Actinomadura madurae]MCP9984313.1 ATP-binding protein [Actinomadura madurae]MCQ0004137.1 ATP-binding protein [Actinomadura madurae]
MAISEVIAALTLPGAERAARHVRGFARDVLGEGHPSLGDVQTCVNEAFTNAVEHTASGCGGRVTVMFSTFGADIVAEVVDDGALGARPVMRDDPLAVDGRGLRIIDALTLEWSVRADGERTAVWMRFPGPPPLR